MYKKNKLIPNTLCGMFCFAILVLLQGCYAMLGAVDVIASGDYSGGAPFTVHPACQLECITTDTEISEIVPATGLNPYGVEACIVENDKSHLSSLEYCEKWLHKYCERAAEKRAQENPLYSQCTAMQASECIWLGSGHFG